MDITDKVSIIALISALIIGSSVVSFGPMVFDMPVISLIGYIIAIILSIIGMKKFVLKSIKNYEEIIFFIILFLSIYYFYEELVFPS